MPDNYHRSFAVCFQTTRNMLNGSLISYAAGADSVYTAWYVLWKGDIFQARLMTASYGRVYTGTGIDV